MKLSISSFPNSRETTRQKMNLLRGRKSLRETGTLLKTTMQLNQDMLSSLISFLTGPLKSSRKFLLLSLWLEVKDL
jgi:hypothetical protein